MNNLKYIFISSTFSDFHSERDVLNNKILPKLNEKLRPLGYEVCFIDLRWGINDNNDEQTQNYLHIINTCINEVRNSKPYFILFLGDNVGTKIDKDLIEKIYKFNEIDQENESKSITQIEIDASPIFSNDNSKCLVFKRNLTEVPENLKIKFLNTSNADYVNKIKNTLQNKDNFVEYEGKVLDDGSVSFDEEIITNKIINFIYDDYSKGEANNKNKSIYEIDKEIFDSKIETTSSLFVGREKYIENIENLIRNKSIVKITGKPGIGKTFLINEIYKRLNVKNKFLFDINNCYGKGDINELLQYFAIQITGKKLESDSKYYPITEPTILRRKFISMFQELDPNDEYYLFIDSFDKLKTYSCFNKENLFFENQFTHQVHIILCGNDINNPDIKIGGITEDEILNIAKKKTLFYKKQLPDDFLISFSNQYKKKFENPFLLKMAIDDLIFLTKEDFAQINSNNYNESLTKLLLEKTSLCEDLPELEFERKLMLLKKTSPHAFDYLTIIALNNNGYSLTELKDTFESLNYGLIKFSVFDFELAKTSFYSNILMDKYRKIRISNDIFKKTILKNSSKDLIKSVCIHSILLKTQAKNTNYDDIFDLIKIANEYEIFLAALTNLFNNHKNENEFYKCLHFFLKETICTNNSSFKEFLNRLAKDDIDLFILVLRLMEHETELYYLIDIYGENYQKVFDYLLLKNLDLCLEITSNFITVLCLHGKSQAVDVLILPFLEKNNIQYKNNDLFIINYLYRKLQANCRQINRCYKNYFDKLIEFLDEKLPCQNKETKQVEMLNYLELGESDSKYAMNSISLLTHVFLELMKLDYVDQETIDKLTAKLKIALHNLFSFAKFKDETVDIDQKVVTAISMDYVLSITQKSCDSNQLFEEIGSILKYSNLSIDLDDDLIYLMLFTYGIGILSKKVNTVSVLKYIAEVTSKVLVIGNLPHHFSMLIKLLIPLNSLFLNDEKCLFNFNKLIFAIDRKMDEFNNLLPFDSLMNFNNKFLCLKISLYLKDNINVQKYQSDIVDYLGLAKTRNEDFAKILIDNVEAQLLNESILKNENDLFGINKAILDFIKNLKNDTFFN